MKWIYVVLLDARDDRGTRFINAERVRSIGLSFSDLHLGDYTLHLPPETKREDARRFLYTLVNCLSKWQDGRVLTVNMNSLSCQFDVFQQSDKAKANGKG